MDGKDEPPREQARAGLCAYPCPSRTPSINGKQGKQQDEVTWVAHWGRLEDGAPPFVPLHFAIVSHLQSDRGG
jgi:hypothetical protein